ncbi:hypothetical protein [Mycobacterium sp.]|uniref:hypothetical protein n=1 Tax=Mycobacterium sp. TaxID=1785 RepID=UPI003BB17B3E
MRHSRFLAPAPQNAANSGAVPTANNDAPIMNDQHWARSISIPSRALATTGDC